MNAMLTQKRVCFKSPGAGLISGVKWPGSQGGERDGAAAMPISGRRTTPPKRRPNRVRARAKAEVVTAGRDRHFSPLPVIERMARAYWEGRK